MAKLFSEDIQNDWKFKKSEAITEIGIHQAFNSGECIDPQFKVAFKTVIQGDGYRILNFPNFFHFLSFQSDTGSQINKDYLEKHQQKCKSRRPSSSWMAVFGFPPISGRG